MHRPAKGIRAWTLIVGEEAWGFVYFSDNERRSGWQAFSYNAPQYATPEEALKALLPDPDRKDYKSGNSLQMVKGFLSRRTAATYIVKHWGYWESN
ncbi:hypothetical protein ACWD4N_48815 [Streptomyces sp. NPDC002586]